MDARLSQRSQTRRLVLLAPSTGDIKESSLAIEENSTQYARLLADMQRMRGRIYLEDGAIQESQLSLDGRHQLETDRQSWHLLLADESNRVLGCMRYVSHNNSVPFGRLGLSSSAIAQCDLWGAKLKKGIRSELAKAREDGSGFAEVGGWALENELRCSMEALRMVLATYALSQVLGDARGVSTATTRNGSASILRRIGGSSVFADGVELPKYFDPHYNCEMELLRFDCAWLNPRYAVWVEQLRAELFAAPVYAASSVTRQHSLFLHELSTTRAGKTF